jgi:hypothetical protein
MGAILFFDPVCQQPYDTRTLTDRATGGTEATLTRVADALDALVMQQTAPRPGAVTCRRARSATSSTWW